MSCSWEVREGKPRSPAETERAGELRRSYKDWNYKCPLCDNALIAHSSQWPRIMETTNVGK